MPATATQSAPQRQATPPSTPRPPRLDQPFDRRRDGSTRTVSEALIDLVRAGNHVESVCAIVGVNRKTVYEWARKGARAHSSIVTGQRKRGDLTKLQRACADFNLGMRAALAEAENRAVVQLQRLALGGGEVTTTVETLTAIRDADGRETGLVEVNRKVTTRTLAPDYRALVWFLERRFPDRWAKADEPDTLDLDELDDEQGGTSTDPVAVLDKALRRMAQNKAQAVAQLEAAGLVLDVEVVDTPAADEDTPL